MYVIIMKMYITGYGMKLQRFSCNPPPPPPITGYYMNQQANYQLRLTRIRCSVPPPLPHSHRTCSMYVYAYLVAIASVLKYGVRNEPKHVLVELSVSKSQKFSCCFVIDIDM